MSADYTVGPVLLDSVRIPQVYTMIYERNIFIMKKMSCHIRLVCSFESEVMTPKRFDTDQM